jgi:hypothetical protein
MSTEEIRIALPRGLSVTPEEFAEAWNSMEDSHNKAQADTEQTRGIADISEILVVLSNIGVGVLSSAVYDLIRQVLALKRFRLLKITEEKGILRIEAEPLK